jgi:hypothetical protein
MPFDYLHPCRNPEFEKRFPDRFREQHLSEIRERAGLLFNLRYPVEKAARRIKANIAWEFDDTWTRRPPAFFKEVDDIVRSVYSHRSRGSDVKPGDYEVRRT